MVMPPISRTCSALMAVPEPGAPIETLLPVAGMGVVPYGVSGIICRFPFPLEPGRWQAVRRPRRKICDFCAGKVAYIDYKDVNRLRRYITERGPASGCDLESLAG